MSAADTIGAMAVLDMGGFGSYPGRVAALEIAMALLTPDELGRLRIETSARGPAGTRYAYGDARTRVGRCRYIGTTGPRLLWAVWS